MASSPRAGRSSAALGALVVGALLVLGVIVVIVAKIDVGSAGQRIVSSLYPPAPVTDRAVHIRDLYNTVFAIAVVIFFVVEALIIWTVIRYRRKPGDDELPPQTHGNAVAEVVWTVVPTLIVAFMFVISWQTLNSVEAISAEPQTKIRAVAGQFQWSFEYLPPDSTPKTCSDTKPVYQQFLPTGEGGGLVVPAGRTVQLFLCSPDVIHAFYVPQFLFKRDVVPGIVNQFDLEIPAEDAGQTYRGQCAELCGVGHRIMVFEVHILSDSDFQAWTQKQIQAANATPPPAPSGGAAGGPPVDLTAVGVKFDKTDLTVPAAGFTLHYDNKDASTPHDFDILDQGGTKVFDSKEFNGPKVEDLPVPALPAGQYKFECSIHPTLMNGTLTVQ